MLWKVPIDIALLNAMPPNIAQLIGIEFTACDDESLTARMPVDARTHQPLGILHGGASVVLAESLGSIASNMIIDTGKYVGVGLEVNAQPCATGEERMGNRDLQGHSYRCQDTCLGYTDRE